MSRANVELSRGSEVLGQFRRLVAQGIGGNEPNYGTYIRNIIARRRAFTRSDKCVMFRLPTLKVGVRNEVYMKLFENLVFLAVPGGFRLNPL